MTISAFGHALTILFEGVTAVIDGEPSPIPLADTSISIEARPGLATITFTRRFENNGDEPIEAILTMPSAFDSVLTGLAAEIDGRRLVAAAKGRGDAREAYEEAVAEGRLAVLHEEPLRGIHMLSIGPIAPGKEVTIESTFVQPLSLEGSLPFLRVPLTVGEIYGTSPFIPVDDLLVDPNLEMTGRLHVDAGPGHAILGGVVLSGETMIPLNRAIEIRFEGLGFGTLAGTDAKGRTVTMRFEPGKAGEMPLDLAILIDRSGSTGAPVNRRGKSVLSVIHDAVLKACSTLTAADRVSIWEFDDQAELLIEGHGNPFAAHPVSFGESRGGTELGHAVRGVLTHRKTPVLVFTDGQTHASEAHLVAAKGMPVHAVLVGEGSLDATIGHLASITGGQVLAANGDDATNAALRTLATMRLGSIPAAFERNGDGSPRRLVAMRGGVQITAEWHGDETARTADATGAFAAALALPHLPEEEAEDLAVAHGLATHLTSLVLVDSEGEACATGLPRTEKVPLPGPAVFKSAFHSVYPMVRQSMDPPPVRSAQPMFLADMALEEAGPTYVRPRKRPTRSSRAWTTDPDKLPLWLQKWVAAVKDRPEIEALARDLGITPERAALFIRAAMDRSDDRAAERVFRMFGRVHGPEALARLEALAELL